MHATHAWSKEEYMAAAALSHYYLRIFILCHEFNMLHSHRAHCSHLSLSLSFIVVSLWCCFSSTTLLTVGGGDMAAHHIQCPRDSKYQPKLETFQCLPILQCEQIILAWLGFHFHNECVLSSSVFALWECKDSCQASECFVPIDSECLLQEHTNRCKVNIVNGKPEWWYKSA